MAEPATKPEAERATPDEVIARQRNRQVMILTVIIIVLAGLVWLTRSTRTEEPKNDPVPLVGGTKDAPAFKKEDVAQIEIWAGKDRPFILTRDDGGWRVPARFGAPADRNDIDALLTKLFEAKRLGRPSTEDTSRYVEYELGDDEAVHLRLQSTAGKELLHLLVGRADDGARDFVRLTGENPAGIFELAGGGGAWDTLYSRLQRDVDAKSEPKRWLDLTAFKVIESGTRVDRITITDGDRTFEFKHDPLAEDKWDVLQPRQGDGETPAIRGVIGALENLAASDIAGRDTDGGSLGIATSRRFVVLDYLVDSKPTKATVTFGEKKDGLVAVHLKSNNQGALIHWVNEYVLDRVFRKPGDFIRRADLGLVPVGADVDRLRVTNGDKLLDLKREAPAGGTLKEWKLITPAASRADRLAVTNLLTSLNTQRGLKHLGPMDFVALGVDPSTSKRWIELSWPEKGEKKEGEAEPPVIVKTGALYFGNTDQGEIAVLVRVTGKEDAVFWLDEETTKELFVDPAEYVAQVKVRHVLITWKGKFDGAAPKDPERTEAQARELVQKILERIKAGEDFVKLQVEFNEDSVADNEYTVARDTNFVAPFKELSFKLALGAHDTCETQFGIHIIKRTE